MRNYRLISADSHVSEPPGVWVDRMPQRFKDRAPHMVSLEKGDAWIFEGYPEPINFGLNQCGGLPPERRVAWIRWEDARAAGYDPAVRLADMDQDGVDADILYPTPRPSIAMVRLQDDPELHLAQVQAYNNWLSEFCSHDLANRVTSLQEKRNCHRQLFVQLLEPDHCITDSFRHVHALI